ncbi:L-threonine dehydratase catabolic TdcB [Tritrichomonas foetus]|uniref:L-threonine dehydratase catabolic TdcB n=1 Tax=Tritrichomonas foetus TaxID=1144522 RepID=A0A1J4K2Q5_9EUKA|nr:L-threonine dehydratase catabolic TdcB [Tritrichomonas foetus]|eukprot:OHT03773.1 L-threonine dehydratase catabolic TdcB [Tritrichomonas foetus]
MNSHHLSEMSEHKSIDEIITMEKVYAAAERIKEGGVVETELLDSDNLQTVTGCKLYLKLENQQRCRSFKIRGAYNKIKQLPEGSTVVSVSSGNHAQGIACAAGLCHCNAIIYMSNHVPNDKINATKQYGATVVQKGENFDGALAALQADLADHPDWIYVSPFDDEDIIVGNATLGLELFNQINDVQTVVIPVGGGALIAGVSYALKKLNPKIKIIGVQMSSSPKSYNLWCKNNGLDKNVVERDSLTPLADGIAIRNPGELCLPFIYELVDDFVIVKEDEVALAVSLLAERGKMIAEGAGAAAFAAVNSKKFEFSDNEVVVAIVSGGNIPLQLLARCIDRALFLNGTRKSLQVILPYGTKYLYTMTTLLVENHAEVVSYSSIPHIDTVANKEHYSVIIDVANPESVATIVSEFQKRGWGISVSDTAVIDEE